MYALFIIMQHQVRERTLKETANKIYLENQI